MYGESHPTGVRGLKLVHEAYLDTKRNVAPHRGAWIETLLLRDFVENAPSHPTGVRGLKL